MWKVIVLQIFLNIVFIECVIPPTLNVQKLDKKLIARKRQDTLEMCRLFNENNQKLEVMSPINSFTNPSRRYKREINNEDEDRVEVLVDKMYDDLAEKGEVVNYKKSPRTVANTMKTASTPVGEKSLNKTSGRRFFFAPSLFQLQKGDDQDKEDKEDTPEPAGPWPKTWKHGIIPYFIDPKTYDNHLADIIMSAFAHIEKKSCIRLQKLREKPIDDDSLMNVQWLYITNPSGIRQCVHSNEHKINKGVQMVVFGYHCLNLGEIVHEIMHVLGFSHEHTRHDRDDHVTILWDNIKPGYKKYFEVRTKDILTNLPYDYSSVLHYPPRAFSKNGKLTIAAEDGKKLGQREVLSETDLDKIELMYGTACAERNRNYLLETCPNAMANPPRTESRIDDKQLEDKIKSYFKDRIWPYGIVNYRLRDKLEFTIEERENIAAVIKHIEKETCIEFRDVDAFEQDEEPEDSDIDNNVLSNPDSDTADDPSGTGDEAYRRNVNNSEPNATAKPTVLGVTLKPPAPEKKSSRRHAENILTLARSAVPGCKCPKPGKTDGDQVLNINHDCFNSVNDLLHLFVHLLGLDHQHNTHDRNDYIIFNSTEMTEDIRNELSKELPEEASVGFPYDYHSVMHYPWLQIKDGVTSIMYPVWIDGWAMGRWQGLSSIDIQKLYKIYEEQCQARRKQENDKQKRYILR